MLAKCSETRRLTEWRFLYTDGMKKLNALIKDLKDWLFSTKRILYIHLMSRNVVIEAVLSNPLLSIFSNVIPNQ